MTTALSKQLLHQIMTGFIDGTGGGTAKGGDGEDDKGKVGVVSREGSAGHTSGGSALVSPHVRCLAVPQPWRLY